jgi:catechol 2,3-dioxygenase-like lactoylglutathione lyase family enzyme
MSAVVRRIDHVNVVVPDPHALFSFLADRLELPVAWSFTRFPSFASGAVALGLNLEPVRYAPTRKPRAPLDSGLFALAFEPEPTASARAELARRGIPHSPPIAYRAAYPPEAETDIFGQLDRASGKRVLWTLVILGGLIGNERLARDYSRPPMRGDSRLAPMIGRLTGRVMASRRLGDRLIAASGSATPFAFLCEYHGFNIADSRKLAAEELERRGGGPLGAVTTEEIVIEARDARAETSRWQRLLDPIEPSGEGVWRIGDRPVLRVVEGSADRIQALVWRVRSLDAAEKWLEHESLLGRDGDGLTIAPEATQGVEIRLVS